MEVLGGCLHKLNNKLNQSPLMGPLLKGYTKELFCLSELPATLWKSYINESQINTLEAAKGEKKHKR